MYYLCNRAANSSFLPHFVPWYHGGMKDFLARCKKMFSGPEKQNSPDVASVMKRVDEQVGRAVTRLADR